MNFFVTPPPAGAPRTLILMRHAQAALGGYDFDRPLSERGRHNAALQGARLAALLTDSSGPLGSSSLGSGGAIDLALVSKATRTRQTFAALHSVGVTAKKVRYRRELYDASWDEARELIRAVDPRVRTLLVLFHQSSVGALAYMLTSPHERDNLGHGFSPATFAIGRVTEPWSELSQWHDPQIYAPPQ